MATAKRRLACATAEEYLQRTVLIFLGGSTSKEIKNIFSAVEMIVTIFEFLLFVLCCLIASITSYWDYELSYIKLNSGPVVAKSWNFRAKLFRGLQKSNDWIFISPPQIILQPIIPRSEKPLSTPVSAQVDVNQIQCRNSCCSGDQVHNQLADLLGEHVNSILRNQTGTIIPPTESPQEHANPNQCQTFCCSGDDVHNQQTDPPVEPVNSPLHNRTDNASASFDIEAGGDIEARGASLNEASSSDAGNEAEAPSPQTGNQNPPPHDDDGMDETPSNEVNITAASEDHKGRKEVEFVFIVGGQIIATGIAAFALNNTSNVSSEAEVLQHILIGCMFVSLISLFYGLWLSVCKPRSLAARVVRVIGHVAMAFTLLIVTGLNLPNSLMLWGTLGACTVCLPAIILYAIK
ncbi:uncharacterized protein LOC123219967 isoform X2 [Mangifera indica]|uniref:uncharacterized protein LOC123219967 isoform X2 n=1 Tax=Mangifera indica TaxID=29780 RepID=UPI001CFC3BF6|nr:uncharacterized protein LOC123219967 isoform X2 [Mangifera indica]